MRAMLLQSPGNLLARDIATPKPKAGEVLVRTAQSGVCGTDLKIFSGAIPVTYPLIMGHEVVGWIEDAGENREFKKGDRVIVDPVLFCGRCFFCHNGDTHLCRAEGIIGREHDGGFAEFLCAPAGNIFHLPDSIEFRVAPVIQVLTTCVHAHRRVETFPGQSIVVIGLGVTGLLHIQLAKARGAYPVVGISRSASKRKLAEELGADFTLESGEENEAQILPLSNGRGADLIIDTVGRISSLSSAVQMARPGGTLLLFGINTEKQGPLPFYQFYFKELRVINARAAKGEDFTSSLDLVRRGVVKLEPLVTNVMGLAELAAAIELLRSDDDRRLKIILNHE